MKSLGNIRRSFSPWSDPDARPMIAIRNVTKRFGEFTAVDDLSVDIHAREFFALLGASGCGKSTLLRMLAGFEAPNSGTIVLDGVDLAGIPPHRRPLNMMFQSYALFPHMSVADNVAFGLKQEKMAKGAIAERVGQMLKLVKLDRFAGRKPHQLSGGQRQRVALARALAKQPKVLLLDEPLGALDKKLREETQFELTDLQYDLGLTFVVVTHDQEEAMTMADRIAVMDAGRICQVATPAEVYEAPNSKFVADFIGSINLFDGEVASSQANRTVIAGPDGSVVAEDPIERSPGTSLCFAVRPEKIAVSHEPPAEGTNGIAGEVWDLAYLGDMTIFHVKLASGTVIKASMVNAARSSREVFTYHDRVWLSFSPDAGVVLER
ncbi:ABC transporter ATP-binding protein [Pararhizobium haloflavum]|uniref:ABC transporter ATP-binding protein n=1 Tax=Pararhizobium haloflavum TaxID=2037914 RepID=UPI000C1922A8|nr:ABC transporter ATP-binding protein [Pararhizobium haloflavum]